MSGRFLAGVLCPKCRIIRHASAYAYLVEFIKRHPSLGLASRLELYKHVNDEYVCDKPVCLVELGVWRGDSIRRWAEINSHPHSRFYGLDTFEGLPEDWQHLFGVSPKGTFTAEGVIPSTRDPRIAFVKGLIQKTLKPLLGTLSLSGSSLVLNFDADLYTTTLYGLSLVDTVLLEEVNSYIAIFDEFSSANDEFRAFVDYHLAYRRTYTVLGHVGKCYDQVAIRIAR